jgi:membrane-associated phospholipid phosphatase
LQPSAFDLAFFASFAGAATPNPWALGVAKLIAVYSGWVLAVALLVFVWRDKRHWPVVLSALLVCWLGSLLARELSTLINCPRPFMLGLSPNHISQGSRGSFPSAHATAMASLLGALWFSARFAACQAATSLPWRALLVGVSLTALATAWARFYVGAHFASDVLAGLLLGLLWGYVVQMLLHKAWFGLRAGRVAPALAPGATPGPGA